MKMRIVRNKVNPITGTRMNEMNEMFLHKLIDEMNSGYFRGTPVKKSKDERIIECYRKAWLAYQLYSCLVEEDDERLRECVQSIADEKLNDIVMSLVEFGYIF